MNKRNGAATRQGGQRDACPRLLKRPRSGWSAFDNELITRGPWPKLSGLEAKVYMALQVHKNDLRLSWPSLKLLAEEVGRHWTRISGAVQGLARKGIIEIRRTGRFNVYYIRTLREVMKTHSENATSDIAKPLKGTRSIEATPLKVAPKKQALRAETSPSSRRPQTSRPSIRQSADKQEYPRARPPILPDGFPRWLDHLNVRLGLRPPKGYRPTSPMGRRLAVAYVRALAEGHTEEDLRRAIDVAMSKARRGFEAASRPTWILGNLDELTAEASRPVEGGRLAVAPIFRSGADAEVHREAMRNVVERPAASNGR